MTIEAALTKGRLISRITIDMRVARVIAFIGYRERHTRTGGVVILTESLRKALFGACKDASDARIVALLVYAGIRTDAEHGEITRLDWADIGRDFVTIHGGASKTATDRLIPITLALRGETKSHPANGSLKPAGWKRAWSRIRKAAGVIAHDVTRHMFASHFLARKGNDTTKNALSHAAESSTLFRHSLRAVPEEAGKAYFA